jgi:hypothetical protein
MKAAGVNSRRVERRPSRVIKGKGREGKAREVERERRRDEWGGIGSGWQSVILRLHSSCEIQ